MFDCREFIIGGESVAWLILFLRCFVAAMMQSAGVGKGGQTV